ncbi:MAG: hypothetical protein M1832_004576 [Thelocarpon impressellum]|nr:MAG: hypothetical protein M1832_004576 [Thelocarpon impressellum]
MQAMPTEEELAQLQKLSDEFRPEVEGPLVGRLQSSDAITSEYAHADPVFVQKTAALPQKYSHYRTVKGDGNCGWRAIAFGYFETLQRVGDRARVLEEETRLRSLNNLLNTAGFEEHLYDVFVDETVALLRVVAASIPAPPGDTVLLDRFNEPDVSNAVVTHFRLLTSAWMKTRPDGYQPFILDGTVEQYCASQIEPYQVEIEHIGMNAMIDALVKPAGFAVEILYLDRSPGAEVNEHRFEASDVRGAPLYDAPAMRLLYRPGHYDILYKAEDVGMALPQTRVALVDVGYGELPTANPGAAVAPYMHAIPGMSFAGLAGAAATPMAVSNGAAPESLVPSPVSPVGPAPPSPGLPLSPATAGPGQGSFRPSKYEYEEFFPSPAPDRPLQTATFRNSHFNPAHFLNSDFQPEMWSPQGYGGRAREEPH